MGQIQNAQGAPEAAGTKPAHIFLVEDNPGDVYLFRKALQQRQIIYELSHHEDGGEAIRALSDESLPRPDLIVVDLKLLRVHGFDVLSEVRRRPRLVGVPLCILTSSDAESDRHRVDLFGAVRYIHKPPTLEEFLDRVGSAIEAILRERPAE